MRDTLDAFLKSQVVGRYIGPNEVDLSFLTSEVPPIRQGREEGEGGMGGVGCRTIKPSPSSRAVPARFSSSTLDITTLVCKTVYRVV